MDCDGVIWCPGCDELLPWQHQSDGQKRLTDDAYEHLESWHDYHGSRVLKEPAAV